MFNQRAAIAALSSTFVCFVADVSAQDKAPAPPDSKEATSISRPSRPPRSFPLFAPAHAAEVGGWRDIDRPAGWPGTRRWAPRRYFGPLFGASPIVRLHGTTAAFAYGTYFSASPDKDVFRKYYGPVLPTGPDPQGERVPGAFPSATGFHDVILNLEQLNYSSRYGGSFKLSFLSTEDSGIEFRSNTSAWDIGSLEMNVYVRPMAAYFNRGPLVQSQVAEGDIHVEFAPQAVVAYRIGTDGILVPDSADPAGSLAAALEPIGRALTNAAGALFRLDAARFSHGLVHAEFWEEIGDSSKVDSILVSDGLFLPTTSAPRPVAMLTMQVAMVNLDTEPGSEEIFVSATAEHVFTPTSTNAVTYTFPEMDDHGSSVQRVMGVFPLDWDCAQLQTVQMTVSVREEDTSVDDRFLPSSLAFQTGALPCDAMKSAFASGFRGEFSLPAEASPTLLLMSGGEVSGSLTIKTRLFLLGR